jgi:diacylglycerol kinase family enzyme
MRRFDVDYADGGGERHHASLTELLAVRIRFFGNVLRELVPGASLDCGEVRTVMCRTASRNAYLQYVAGALLGRHWNVKGIDVMSCSEILCRLAADGDGHHAGSGQRVYVEADGELLGRLPARLTMVQDALSLIVPA